MDAVEQQKLHIPVLCRVELKDISCTSGIVNFSRHSLHSQPAEYLPKKEACHFCNSMHLLFAMVFFRGNIESASVKN